MTEKLTRTQILAVEGYSILSDGLASLFSRQPDMELRAIAGNSEEARKCFAEISPDVTLVDVDMSGGEGLDMIRELRRDHPGAVIIALVSYEWDALALEAVALGAAAFVPKDRIMALLPDLIRESTHA
jgi:DNA-binding NarL/FixJ family response regulator